MPTTFRAYQPDSTLAFAAGLAGVRFPQGSLAHHVSDVVDALDFDGVLTAAPREGDQVDATPPTSRR